MQGVAFVVIMPLDGVGDAPRRTHERLSNRHARGSADDRFRQYFCAGNPHLADDRSRLLRRRGRWLLGVQAVARIDKQAPTSTMDAFGTTDCDGADVEKVP